MTNRGNIERVVCGDNVGTVVVKDTDSTRFAANAYGEHSP
jgi:hypothetical protein